MSEVHAFSHLELRTIDIAACNVDCENVNFFLIRFMIVASANGCVKKKEAQRNEFQAY